MIGNGRGATEKTFERVTEKFRWGNFDKEKLFVDRSYNPSIQTTKMVMLRTVGALLREGKRDKALALLDQHFEAFPHMNFPYDNNTMAYLSYYAQAGAFEKAIPHIKILANEFADLMRFYQSLDEGDRQASFASEESSTKRFANELLNFVRNQGNDKALTDEITQILNPYIGS